jgi:dihydroxyacetone kinase-like protein
MEENRDFLTQLDAAIGDADHGINMDRGFKKVSGKLASLEEEDIGSIMRQTGMALISSVGGASGPLYGTFFLKAAATASGKQSLNLDELTVLFKAGLFALMDRGKAQPGDKTIVDALAPAVETLEFASQENTDIKEALGGALVAAEQGMKRTIPMIAKKGRASYMGERSIGHQDPGATSSYLILKALYDSVS